MLINFIPWITLLKVRPNRFELFKNGRHFSDDIRTYTRCRVIHQSVVTNYILCICFLMKQKKLIKNYNIYIKIIYLNCLQNSILFQKIIFNKFI